ncbi:cytochrome P450 [Nocardiopsis terrae]|uniref:Cytochrome P450 n=1 Tax=Nocardiopsis terrae TaxID=372655 RepID=A0ABR9HJ04_9ACTN|nr:cytochrome P450 [Nocardiopsis terrae]MBE1458978.1 cytochrome P450 [Nocardiopsis terrae]GHC87412.1 cytochrome P450 [Nocardiopsis terrae]
MTTEPPALHGPEFEADPHPAYRWLRENDPVHRVDLPGGAWAWVVTRHEDALRVLTDPNMLKDPARGHETWYRAGLGLPYDHRPSLVRSMVNADGPDHVRLRRVVSGAFSPRRVRTLRERAERITDELLTVIEESEEPDLVRDLAYPLPITVICEVLGVPEADRPEFRRQASVIDSASYDEVRAIAGATDWFDSYLGDLVDARLARPSDDLLGDLVESHRAGELSRDEVTSTAFLLLVAGQETTLALIGNMLLTLLRNPGAMRRIRDDRSLLDPAIEESLRLESPLQNATWRFPAEPTTVGGTHLEAGEPVLVSLLAAGRDPERYEDPDGFDPGRGAAHLSFGQGAHFCVGAQLARMEARVAVGAVLDRLPGLRLAVEEAELRWWPSMIMHGLFALPVEFDRRKR